MSQLEQMVESYANRDKNAILVPNDPAYRTDTGETLHKDMGNRIALVAWRWLDKCDEYDGNRISAFVEKYEGIDRHQ